MGKYKRKLIELLLVLALCLALCGIGYYVSRKVFDVGVRWIEALSLNELRIWAVLVTLVLPVTTITAFFLGRHEAQLLRDGMRMGVNEVSTAADNIATVKGKLADRMKQPPVTVQVAAGALPAPQMFHKQIEGESERVDL
jgi:Kef-type K+ transport system membrane component KefB